MNRRLWVSNAAMVALLACAAFTSQAGEADGTDGSGYDCLCNVDVSHSGNLDLKSNQVVVWCPQDCKGSCTRLRAFTWTGEGRWDIRAGEGTAIHNIRFYPDRNLVTVAAQGWCSRK
jgi:hypothetical protein